MLPESTKPNRGLGVAKYVGKLLLKLLLTLLLGGFLGASLVRFAPGFNVDEESLDPRLSSESQQALRASRAQNQNVAQFYLNYLADLTHGQLGVSRTLARPVSELLRERLPVTLKSVTVGWAMGWCLGLGTAISAVTLRSSAYDSLTRLLAGATLFLPAAVMC